MFSLPNILSIMRLLLIPVFVYVFFNKSLTWALIVFLFASLTDVLDGYIARRYNMVTKSGKLLDPLADKLMLVTVLCCLYINSRVPLWVLVLVCAKELAMLIGAMVLLNKGNIIAANFIGKATTAAFMLAIVFALLFQPGYWLTQVVLYAAFGLTVVSIIKYGISALEYIRSQEK